MRKFWIGKFEAKDEYGDRYIRYEVVEKKAGEIIWPSPDKHLETILVVEVDE